ncbi:terminase [Curtobacterium phage Parvaparticeps]|nr:terminase [Curtobacterium phage Parvaparticeps]
MTAVMEAPRPRLIDGTAESLSPKQLWSIATSNSRLNLWDGSIRSGKTIASLIRWAMFVATAPRGGELVVVGRTRESIARNVFGPLTDPEIMGSLARVIKYTPGAPTATMFGRVVHVIGFSDVRAENVIRGMTLSGAYVDEITLAQESFFTQLIGRMSVVGAMLFGTTNPDGPRHWFKVKFLDRVQELGYAHFHFRLEDNTILCRNNPEYIAQVKKEYTGLWYLRFIEGQWVQADGAVYDVWDERLHVVQPGDIPTIQQVLCVALDFGDLHPTRAYAIGVGQFEVEGKKTEPRLYTLAEYAPSGKVGARRMTVAEYSKGFRQFHDRVAEKWGKPKMVAVDPAAGSFKTQLFYDGLTAWNAHNAVLPGIRTISALLAVQRLQVSAVCTELVKMVPAYMWDAKAQKDGRTEVLKENDDEVDAWRYAVYTCRRYWRTLIPLTIADDNAPEQQDEE